MSATRAALALPIALGVLHAPAIRAQSQLRPKFAVVSVKPCRESDVGPGRKTGRGGGDFSPGTLRMDCTTVRGLIQRAYVTFANGRVNPRARVPVEGGPAWIDSARYQIDAKTSGPQNQAAIQGPMLQTLLEDRFKLKIHHETREVPAYALTVVKGGPKLSRFQEGTCTPFDFTIFEQFPPPPRIPDPPPGQKYCGGIDPHDGSRWFGATVISKGPNVTLEARALSIDDFIKQSLPKLDRPIFNQTGISGLFDFHLEFSEDDDAGPSIFTALQHQLGLKLDPAKAPGDFLVIDQVQKPAAN